MSLPITILAIAAPTFIYAWLVRRVDRYEREPTKYLVFAFLWGAVPAIVIGLVLELILQIPVQTLLGDGTAGQLAEAAVIAPVVEEITKGILVAIVYFLRRREFDGWVDGIVYGSTVGFGFAFVENIFYIVDAEDIESWIVLFFMRVIVFGFMHGFWTSLTGIGFGIARSSHKPWVKLIAPWVGLLCAIIGHMVHNGSLVLAEATTGATICLAGLNYLIMIGLIIGLGVVAARNDSAALKTYLFDEVPDTISAADYAALCKTQKNIQARFHIAPKRQRQFVQACAELAQRKQQLIKMGIEGKAHEDIDKLRAQLQRMRE
jgi:RsiW-degrading membrane proteinase PrsW (M82 family)